MAPCISATALMLERSRAEERKAWTRVDGTANCVSLSRTAQCAKVSGARRWRRATLSAAQPGAQTEGPRAIAHLSGRHTCSRCLIHLLWRLKLTRRHSVRPTTTIQPARGPPLALDFPPDPDTAPATALEALMGCTALPSTGTACTPRDPAK